MSSGSSFLGNSAAQRGGAIDTFVAGASTSISNTDFFNNSTGTFGGAVHNHESPLTLQSVNFFSNQAMDGGGAMEGFGAWQIADAHFFGNLTTGALADGGAIRYFTGVSSDSLLVSRVTFESNSASGAGGAIEVGAVPSVNIRVVNSTLSGNTANGGNGGGIHLRNGSLDLNNNTITANMGLVGGGIAMDASASALTSRNTIIAANTAGSAEKDCFTLNPAVLTSQGHNLIGDTTGCTITGAGTGDLLGTALAPLDPRLGPLRQNGGFAPTYALRPSSPAVDAGDPATPGSGGTSCEAVDEQSTTRPLGVSCDIGAFEGTMPFADLSIAKVDNPDPAIFGNNITYTITIANNGPDTAPAVVMDDTLPNNTGFLSAMTTQGSCTPPLGNLLNCALGDLTSGSTVTITVLFTADEAGLLLNQARVSANADEPNFANNSASADTTVYRDFDLRIDNTGFPNPVAVGSNITYTVRVTNQGSPSNVANNVAVTEVINGSFNFVSATPTQGSCTGTTTVTCNLGSLAGQNTATITIVVNATASGSVDSTATVTTTDTDPNLTNNMAFSTTNVLNVADLGITNAGTPDPVGVGLNITYNITVTNNGPAIATNVVVTDQILVSPGSPILDGSIVSIAASQGTCTIQNLVLADCQLGTLASGASATIAVVAVAHLPSTLQNTATVSSDEIDTVPGNNSATATIMVTTANAPDLFITVGDSPDPVTVGNMLSYGVTMRVANGPGSFTNIMITTTLPPGVTANNCSQAGSTVTCGPFSANSSVVATVFINVTPTVPGPLTLTFNATTAPDPDPNTANNMATATTTVVAVPCSKTFDNSGGTGDGQWTTATNWNPDGLPGPTDNVCIPMGFTVALSSGTQSIASLQNGGTLNINGGTLDIASASTVTGALNLSAGTLTGAGSLAFNSTFNWTGGTLSGPSTVDIASSGTLTIGGADHFFSQRTINNSGTATWTGGRVSADTGATFNNLAGATFIVQSDTNWAGISGAAPAFNNMGIFNKTAGTGETVFVPIFTGMPFNNTGNVNVQNGTLTLAGGGTSTGSFSILSGSAVLNFGGGTNDLAATSSVGGTGTVRFGPGDTSTTAGGVNWNGGTANFNGPYNVGTTDIQGGTANFVTVSFALNTTTLTLASGTLTGNGQLNVNNSGLWTGGTMSGAGTTEIPIGATLTISGGDHILSRRGISNRGTTLWTGGRVSADSGGSFFNQAGATFDVQSDTSWAGISGTAPVFNNLGMFIKSAGTGETAFVQVFTAMPFNNTGNATVTVNTGQLTLAGGGTSDGSFTLGGGTTLNFGGGTHMLSASSSVTGAGTVSLASGSASTTAGGVNWSGGTANFQGSYNVTGTVISGSSAAANFNTPSAAVTGSLTQAGGVLAGSGMLNVTSSGSWTGGTMSGTGSTNIGVGATFNIAGGDHIFSQRTITNRGSVSWTGGRVSADSGAMFNNMLGGTFDAQADSNWAGISGAAPAFNNMGVFTRSVGTGEAVFVPVFTGMPFNNNGSVVLVSGTLTLAGGGTSSGGFTVGAATTLNFGGGAHTLDVNSSVTGAGAVSLLSGGTSTTAGGVNWSGGTANFQGGYNVGSTQINGSSSVVNFSAAANTGSVTLSNGSLGPALLSVTNNYTQAAPGILNTEIAGLMAGTQFDQVNAGGTAMLGGTLNVSLIGGFTPTAGNMFTILTAASRTGTFATTNLPALPPDRVWNVNYTATGVQLVVQAVVSTADLSITKMDSPDPVLAGSNVTYAITASNAGPDPATNVALTDTLPGAVTFVSATPSQGTCTGTTTVTCNLGTINSGASATVTIVVTATAAAAPSVSNTASVSATETDPNVANNSATAATTVNPVADLSVTKTDAPDPVVAGTNLTYTITVTNNGPSLATGVTVTDTIPAGTTLVSATASRGTCGGTTTVTCNLGTMPVSGTVTITILVRPTVAGTLNNTAAVAATELDPNPTDNSATATTTVNAQADLSVTKTDAPDPVVINNNLTYTITVSNAGPSTATGVVLTDALPAGPAFVSASSTVGTCSGTTTVTCTIGTLNNGASATVTIVIRPATAGSLSNTATVSANEADPNTANNSATATTTVNAVLFTLGAGAGGGSATVNSGESTTFTITVTPNVVPLVVSFSCANLPPESTCFFQPPGLVFNSLTPQTVTMTVTTTVCVVQTPPGPFGPPLDPRYALPLTTLLAALLLLTGMLWRQPRMRCARAVPALTLLCCVLVLASCASGPDTGNLRRGLTGTIPGTYTITVNATSGGMTQSIPVTLTVKQ